MIDKACRTLAFARLWVAAFLSESAEWMLQIALPVLVYQQTGSMTSTATMMIVGLLPAVAVSPMAGVLADRWNKRVLLWAVCIGQALVAAPLLAANEATVLWLGYGVMAGQAAVASVFEPTRNALVPELVGESGVNAANGLLGAGSNVARLVGASAGGTLFATGGLMITYAAYVSALILAVFTLLVPFRHHRVADKLDQPVLRDWIEGMSVILRDRRIRVAGIVLALMTTAQGVFLVLFIPFVLDTLHGGADHVGLLRGVQAIGGLSGGVTIAVLARNMRSSTLLGCGAIGFGLLSAALWHGPQFSMPFGYYIALFACIGFPAVVAVSGLMSVLQTTAAPALTGRVMGAAFAATALFTAIGMLLASIGTGWFGINSVLNAQAATYILAGIIGLTVLARSQHRKPTTVSNTAEDQVTP